MAPLTVKALEIMGKNFGSFLSSPMLQDLLHQTFDLARRQLEYEQRKELRDSGKTHYEGCWRDHLDCAVRRVEELENQTQWKPIETAPKDGTWILTTALEGPPLVASWQTHNGTSMFGANPEDYADHEHFLQYWATVFYHPTHWMPLPDQPEEAK